MGLGVPYNEHFGHMIGLSAFGHGGRFPLLHHDRYRHEGRPRKHTLESHTNRDFVKALPITFSVLIPTVTLVSSSQPMALGTCGQRYGHLSPLASVESRSSSMPCCQVTMYSYQLRGHHVFAIQTSFSHRGRGRPPSFRPSMACFNARSIISDMIHLRKHSFR